jgi:hypothetical protein
MIKSNFAGDRDDRKSYYSWQFPHELALNYFDASSALRISSFMGRSL